MSEQGFKVVSGRVVCCQHVELGAPKWVKLELRVGMKPKLKLRLRLRLRLGARAWAWIGAQIPSSERAKRAPNRVRENLAGRRLLFQLQCYSRYDSWSTITWCRQASSVRSNGKRLNPARAGQQASDSRQRCELALLGDCCNGSGGGGGS